MINEKKRTITGLRKSRIEFFAKFDLEEKESDTFVLT